jgi:hypothetical protein
MIDIKHQRWYGNTQRGAIKTPDNEELFVEFWPTKCSVDFYGEDADKLYVLKVTGVEYKKFKEKDSNGFYGKYTWKYSDMIPYPTALMKNGGKHPDLNSAPIFKK